MDIVICLHITDLPIIKRNIPLIKKNISGINNLYIISDNRNFKYFSSSFKKKYDVCFIDENQLIDGLTRERVKKLVVSQFGNTQKAGWYLQQFLKLSFSLSLYAKDYYLVWDSDTIPVRPLNFFDDKGRTLFTIKEEYHKPYFDTMQKILGISKTNEGSFIAEHMLFNVSILKEMLCKIENNQHLDGNTWWEKVLLATDPNEPIGFSEFETYGTYCEKFYKNLIAYRKLSTLREGGKIYSFFLKTEEFENFGKEYDTISYENSHYPPFPDNIKCHFYRFPIRILNYLRVKNII